MTTDLVLVTCTTCSSSVQPVDTCYGCDTATNLGSRARELIQTGTSDTAVFSDEVHQGDSERRAGRKTAGPTSDRSPLLTPLIVSGQHIPGLEASR